MNAWDDGTAWHESIMKLHTRPAVVFFLNRGIFACPTQRAWCEQAKKINNYPGRSYA